VLIAHNSARHQVVTDVLGAFCYLWGRAGERRDGGAGGIRTLDRALQPYNGLANRRLQPLGHSSVRADMPDAAASRKRQIQITPRPFRGAGAFSYTGHERPISLIARLGASSGLGGPEDGRRAQRLAWRARREIWPMGEVCPRAGVEIA
jgi:hypothetical protein